jgi:hypothetical protein
MTTAKVLTNNCGFPLFGTRSVQGPMPAAATVKIFPTASLASGLALLLLFEGICWVDFQKRFQEPLADSTRSASNSIEKDLPDLLSGQGFGLIDGNYRAKRNHQRFDLRAALMTPSICLALNCFVSFCFDSCPMIQRTSG